jgi:hypothetical protein
MIAPRGPRGVAGHVQIPPFFLQSSRAVDAWAGTISVIQQFLFLLGHVTVGTMSSRKNLAAFKRAPGKGCNLVESSTVPEKSCMHVYYLLTCTVPVVSNTRYC